MAHQPSPPPPTLPRARASGILLAGVTLAVLCAACALEPKPDGSVEISPTSMDLAETSSVQSGEGVKSDSKPATPVKKEKKKSTLAEDEKPTVDSDVYSTVMQCPVVEAEPEGSKLQATASGKCLTVASDGIHFLGANVLLWPCARASTMMRWTIDGDFYHIRHVASGLCLTAQMAQDKPSDGDNLILWTCREGAIDQHFERDVNGRMMTVLGDKCISDTYQVTEYEGSNAVLWSCEGDESLFHCDRMCAHGSRTDKKTCKCHCAGSWQGEECLGCSHACANGGTPHLKCCICLCKEPWTGQSCEVCGLKKCDNNGELDPGSCTCNCNNLWSGLKCNICQAKCENMGSLNKEECKCECGAGTLAKYWQGIRCEDPRFANLAEEGDPKTFAQQMIEYIDNERRKCEPNVLPGIPIYDVLHAGVHRDSSTGISSYRMMLMVSMSVVIVEASQQYENPMSVSRVIPPPCSLVSYAGGWTTMIHNSENSEEVQKAFETSFGVINKRREGCKKEPYRDAKITAVQAKVVSGTYYAIKATITNTFITVVVHVRVTAQSEVEFIDSQPEACHIGEMAPVLPFAHSEGVGIGPAVDEQQYARGDVVGAVPEGGEAGGDAQAAAEAARAGEVMPPVESSQHRINRLRWEDTTNVLKERGKAQRSSTDEPPRAPRTRMEIPALQTTVELLQLSQPGPIDVKDLQVGIAKHHETPQWVKDQEKKARDQANRAPIDPDLIGRPTAVQAALLRTIPDNFDARTVYAECFQKFHIEDVDICGASWAVAVNSAFSHRMCVQSNGLGNYKFSLAQQLQCNNRYNVGDMTMEMGCEGGSILYSWGYLTDKGITTDECLRPPSQSQLYKEGRHASGLPKLESLAPWRRLTDEKCPRYRISTCQSFFADKSSVQVAVRGDVQSIKAAIIRGGGVVAQMVVHQDFRLYKSGIYQRSQIAANFVVGGHAVVLVGWGTTPQGEYWIAENSFGPHWGEGGYFRIKANTNESGIEDAVSFADPERKDCATLLGDKRGCYHGGRLDPFLCQCYCIGGWSGALCQSCPTTCDNGGKVNPDTCTCDCLKGFFGKFCETSKCPCSICGPGYMCGGTGLCHESYDWCRYNDPLLRSPGLVKTDEHILMSRAGADGENNPESIFNGPIIAGSTGIMPGQDGFPFKPDQELCNKEFFHCQPMIRGVV